MRPRHISLVPLTIVLMLSGGGAATVAHAQPRLAPPEASDTPRRPAPAPADASPDAAPTAPVPVPPPVPPPTAEMLEAIVPGPDAPPPAPEAQPAPRPKRLPPPPKAYRVPPPPPGARYPGMEDIGPGSHYRPDAGELRLSIETSTRLRVLSTDLDALGSRGGASTANGLLSIVTGGLAIALGVIQDDDSFSTFLYIFGAATILRGGVDMIVTPDPTDASLEFSHMPMRDLTEVRQRLQHGERSLQTLADSYRLARILDGSLSLAAGVTIIPLVLVPNDFAFEGPLDVFVVVGAGISAISGIISLATPSEAERRQDAYAQLRARLAKPPAGKPPGSTIRLGLSPQPGGGMLRLAGRF